MSDERKPKIVPYESSTGFSESVERGRKVVGSSNRIGFIWRRIKNYVLWRIAYLCPVNSLRIFCHRHRGVKIGKNVLIGFNCVLDHSFPEYISIDDDAALAGEVYLLTHSCPPQHFKGKLLSYIGPVHISQGAWLGIRATVLPGVTIGKNSVVAAGAVVQEDVEDNVLVQGSPATVVKTFT